MRLALVAFAPLLAACSISSTTEIARPVAGAPPPANVATIPVVGGELIGLAPGELASRVSLVRMDSAATCFDLVTRQPRSSFKKDDGTRATWHLTVDVDGREASRFDLPLRLCEETACLPAGSSLEAYAVGDSNIAALGDRFCVEHAPIAHRELAVVEHAPLGTVTYRFRFSDPAAP